MMISFTQFRPNITQVSISWKGGGGGGGGASGIGID